MWHLKLNRECTGHFGTYYLHSFMAMAKKMYAFLTGNWQSKWFYLVQLNI